jgi:hypothetical protein
MSGALTRCASAWQRSSIVMILGNLRWLFAPENMNLLGAVSMLSLLVGIYKIILARTYGRGPRL